MHYLSNVYIFTQIFCCVKILLYLCCVKGRKKHHATNTKAR